MKANGRYDLRHFGTTLKRINYIKDRKKFKYTANRSYCMINAFNNVFGSLIMKVDDVISSALDLNNTNKSTIFGSPEGQFHWMALKVCCKKKHLGYTLKQINHTPWTHHSLIAILQ
jgi:hypothetical protein